MHNLNSIEFIKTDEYLFKLGFRLKSIVTNIYDEEISTLLVYEKDNKLYIGNLDAMQDLIANLTQRKN